MTDNHDIPAPDRSGSKGNQLVADDSQFVEARPFQGLHLASTLEGLAATNTRAFGGDVSAAIIAAATRQIADDCNDLKLENRRLNERLDGMRNELQDAKIDNAVYKEKIQSEGRNLAIAVGTSMVASGVTLFRSNQDGYAYGLVVFGALLLLLGWFSGSKEGKA